MQEEQQVQQGRTAVSDAPVSDTDAPMSSNKWEGTATTYNIPAKRGSQGYLSTYAPNIPSVSMWQLDWGHGLSTSQINHKMQERIQ